jgi:hypothetical protein
MSGPEFVLWISRELPFAREVNNRITNPRDRHWERNLFGEISLPRRCWFVGNI